MALGFVPCAFALSKSHTWSDGNANQTATYVFQVTDITVSGANYLISWSFTYSDTKANGTNLGYPYSNSSGFRAHISVEGGPSAMVSNPTTENTFTGVYTVSTSKTYIDLYIKTLYAGWTNAGPERVNLGICSDVTVAVTPPSARLGVVGQTLSYAAVKSQGNGQFNFSLTAGTGTLAGNPGTGAFTFTPSAPGYFEITVWTSENYPFCRSADAIVNGTADPQSVNRVTISLDNSAGALARNFKIYQDGNLITSRTVPAGERLIQTITVPNNTPVSIFSVVDGVQKTEGVWHISDGDPFEQEVATVNPTTGPPSDTPPPPAPDAKPVGPNDPRPQDDNNKSVWSSVHNGNVNNNVTNKTYIEGSDKIGEKIDKTNSLLSKLTGEGIGSTSLSDAQAAASQAAQYEGEAPEGNPGNVSAPSAPSSSLGSWQIAPGRSISVSLDPTSLWSGASNILEACRPLLLWAAVVAFIWSCGVVLNTYVAALPQVNAADAAVGIENGLPGVAQGKTWGAAALMVGAVVVAAAALVGVVQAYAYSKGYGIGTLFDSVNLTAAGAGIGLIERYVPVATIINLIVFRAGFSYLVAPLYIGATSAIRFFKA